MQVQTKPKSTNTVIPTVLRSRILPCVGRPCPLTTRRPLTGLGRICSAGPAPGALWAPGPAVGLTCTRVVCACSARAGCLLWLPRCCSITSICQRHLLEIGRLLVLTLGLGLNGSHSFDVGTGLCGLLACCPVRCPACLAAPSATTPGALLLGDRLPEMSARSSVLIALGR